MPPGNTTPDTMTAIEIREHGGPEVLRPTQRPCPSPGEGEVLIAVAAAGINRPDVLQRKGGYPPPPGASDIPGLEVAGTVIAAAPGISWPRVGEKVCALVAGGGYAEYCTAPAGQCLPVPAGLSEVEAAALPETYFTVWSNVFDRGGLRPGESILIHGGSSGIGTTAIQLAKAMGARVFTTVGSAAKMEACRALGADRAINYTTEDFVQVVRSETADGVDVILDMVGGPYIPRNLDCLAADGRLVFIAFLGGPVAEVNFAKLMVRRQTITGSTLRPRPVAFKAEIARRLKETVWPLVESGRVKPVIHETLPLAKAADGHALMESSTHIGKIVLTV